MFWPKLTYIQFLSVKQILKLQETDNRHIVSIFSSKQIWIPYLSLPVFSPVVPVVGVWISESVSVFSSIYLFLFDSLSPLCLCLPMSQSLCVSVSVSLLLCVYNKDLGSCIHGTAQKSSHGRTNRDIWLKTLTEFY